MVSCRDGGHLFCVDCIRRNTESLVFQSGNLGYDRITKRQATELLCMHSDGCGSGFTPRSLERALPQAVLEKHDEMQLRTVATVAGIHNLCTCPQCGFQAELPDERRIFTCPVQDCRHESCRQCGEAPHIPLRCDEVKNKQTEEGRLTVEEAISAARIRTCPQCSKRFVKDDGCNKMVCACGTMICYVCRQEIDGYDHFCQEAGCDHENCGACPMDSTSRQDERRALREAGLRAAEGVQKDAKVEISVDSILQDPGAETEYDDDEFYED
eukprot:CAMPEP_0116848434 /NCGR_PEP_ID=MMETSP0418-20121206/14995_1 /TAXON_ID=1158023 /ORGANISM="Astrosyne radiata, Strain 13vi08-1A" /LENGTH=268 /DNA_ID=CAMNT_0004480005 /DNA_START=194 /DNA_END=1000 /DNA_ORIENTATION=+